MTLAPMRFLPLAALVLVACPQPAPLDGGMDVDSGIAVSCDSAEDCAAMGLGAVCRDGACAANVPCANDFECGLGEECSDRTCVFTGCVRDEDCSTGRCRKDVFA